MDKVNNIMNNIQNSENIQLNNDEYWPQYMQTNKYYKWHRTTLINDSSQWKLILDENDIITLDVEKYGNPVYITSRMHPHWPLLYNAILSCSPKSFFEVGMGAANHLYNVNKCAQKLHMNITHIGGCELSQDQYILGEDIFSIDSKLKKESRKYDAYIGDFLEVDIPDTYDVVYDTTVLMHVPSHYIEPFIDKMCRLANKRVICFDWYYEGHTLDQILQIASKYGKVSILDSDNLQQHRKTDNAASSGFIIDIIDLNNKVTT
jgi:hypothetical protein